MRILVTGGAGFIGSRVVAQLHSLGHEVRVLDALLPLAHGDAGPALPDGVEFVRGDVRSAETVAAALRGVDVVSHQAAIVGRGREILDAPLYASCNDLGTAVLLAEMTRAAVTRLILASSVVLYGEARYSCPEHGLVRPGPREVRDLEAGIYEPRCPTCRRQLGPTAVEETDHTDPRNVYAATKLAQESLVSAWALQTGGSAAALRYHNVYGAGVPQDSPYAGVAATFRSAIAAGVAPEVYEDGHSLRDFVDVRDVAAANTAALRWREPGFRAFNVASGEPRTIGELASALAAAAGSPAPVITGRYRLGDVRHIVASPRRIRRELGWAPAVSFAQGVKEFIVAPLRTVNVDGPP